MKFCLIHNYINIYFLNFGKKQSCVCKIYKHIRGVRIRSESDPIRSDFVLFLSDRILILQVFCRIGSDLIFLVSRRIIRIFLQIEIVLYSAAVFNFLRYKWHQNSHVVIFCLVC